MTEEEKMSKKKKLTQEVEEFEKMIMRCNIVIEQKKNGTYGKDEEGGNEDGTKKQET
jgi:hypothetical protein